MSARVFAVVALWERADGRTTSRTYYVHDCGTEDGARVAAEESAEMARRAEHDNVRVVALQVAA